MKYIIPQSKLESAILEYINSSDIIPDYGWNETEGYKRELDAWGEVIFFLNDDVSFKYFSCGPKHKKHVVFKHFECPILQVWPSVSYKLNDLFGDLWKPVLKRWFEENTGLEVNDITDDYEYL